MKRRLLLARLGGADTTLLASVPTDIIRYTALGGVLLSTAGVAAASAAFALNSALGINPFAAGVVGVLWGAVILNLDRMLIVTMGRVVNWRSALGTALPRIVLAILIGAVISAPLTLRVFAPEIATQVALDKIDKREQSQSRIVDVQKDVDAKQQALAAAQTDKATKPSPDDDAGVRIAFQKWTDAQTTLKNDSASFESSGSSADRQLVANDTLAEQNAHIAYDTARNQRLAAIDAGEAAREASAQSKIESAQKALASSQEARQALQADADAANGTPPGLLDQLGALATLSVQNGAMLLAHLALFLLFVAIEVLPVLVKLLTSSKRTLYDDVLEKREDEARDAEQKRIEDAQRREDAARDAEQKRIEDAQRREDAARDAEQKRIEDAQRREDAARDAEHRREDAARDAEHRREDAARDAEHRRDARRALVAEAQDDVWVQLEQDRAAGQVLAGKEANALLIQTQKKIAAQAVAMWSEVAMSRTDEQLRRWYQAQTGVQLPTMPTPPTPAPTVSTPAAPAPNNGTAANGQNAQSTRTSQPTTQNHTGPRYAAPNAQTAETDETAETLAPTPPSPTTAPLAPVLPPARVAPAPRAPSDLQDRPSVIPADLADLDAAAPDGAACDDADGMDGPTTTVTRPTVVVPPAGSAAVAPRGAATSANQLHQS